MRIVLCFYLSIVIKSFLLAWFTWIRQIYKSSFVHIRIITAITSACKTSGCELRPVQPTTVCSLPFNPLFKRLLLLCQVLQNKLLLLLTLLRTILHDFFGNFLAVITNLSDLFFSLLLPQGEVTLLTSVQHLDDSWPLHQILHLPLIVHIPLLIVSLIIKLNSFLFITWSTVYAQMRSRIDYLVTPC